ncbi:MAG: substrate-binding domain-containing protein [Oliverpabstia sp.]
MGYLKKYVSIFLVCVIGVVSLMGCSSNGNTRVENESSMSFEDAVTEMNSMLKKINVEKISKPVMDIYSDDGSETAMLDDIDTFPIMVEGEGDINIEIAAATELSSNAPDDWINIVAEKFNAEKKEIEGKTVSVSVRKITSGEVVTYMLADAYEPDVFIPSNYAWGEMLQSSGIGIEKITDRIAGNTAGILIEKNTYDDFINKYEEATVSNVLEAALAGDLTFAYTNPYTSSTGLNILTAMLKAFDSQNPLSAKAQEKLLEYQKSSPPVAYTTAVLKNQAAKGIISAMVMEEQAYINTPELASYIYIPAGIRHDHPVYTFSYCPDEKKEAAKLFTEYCLSEENQKLAQEKGFGRHDDYQSDDPGLDGTGYLTAQKVWKQNKNGGRPVVAVFVADVSGSMGGEPLNSLKSSLVNASAYIGQEHYIGLISYSGDVTVNLPIDKFDARQKAYFCGEVKNLSEAGTTATYDAVLVGLNMLQEKTQELKESGVENVKQMMFVLTDGEQNEGYSLDRITPIVAGLQVPVYTISYNYLDDNGELEKLSAINEVSALKASSDDIVNQLRNLFNVEL